MPNADDIWSKRIPVSFEPILLISVCPGFGIKKKNGKVHSPGLQSPHIGYTTLSQSAPGIHDDTISNGFSSEVIWIFCNHRNKTLEQLSLPTNSKLNSSVVYRCYVKQLRVYSNSFRHANFVIHWFPTRCYCIEQCGQTTSDLRAILQKRDNSRATSHKMVYKKTDWQDRKRKIGEWSQCIIEIITQ